MDPHTRLRVVHALYGVNRNFRRSHQIEAAIFCFAMQSGVDVYERKASQVLYNFFKTGDPLLEPTHLAHATNEELSKGNVQAFHDAMEAQEQERARVFRQCVGEALSLNRSAKSGIFCKKCGSHDVVWTEKQTRGADEAMTVFCECNACKSRWRLS